MIIGELILSRVKLDIKNEMRLFSPFVLLHLHLHLKVQVKRKQKEKVKNTFELIPDNKRVSPSVH